MKYVVILRHKGEVHTVLGPFGDKPSTHFTRVRLIGWARREGLRGCTTETVPLHDPEEF